MFALALSLLLAAAPALPPPLSTARRLAEELRYEEAIVEYQRYLGLSDRPSNERARALLELGFLHLLLDDEVNAQRRALEALELDEKLEAPASAPAKQASFVEEMRAEHRNRPRLEWVSSAAEEPGAVRVRLRDPLGRASEVKLRHGLSAQGPFYSAPMRCDESGLCAGFIPPPSGGASFTAWYFVEAENAKGAPVARAASPDAPLQLAILQRSPWYKSPYVYAGGAALLIGAGAVFFAASAPK